MDIRVRDTPVAQLDFMANSSLSTPTWWFGAGKQQDPLDHTRNVSLLVAIDESRSRERLQPVHGLANCPLAAP